jgi:hypothetical protein
LTSSVTHFIPKAIKIIEGIDMSVVHRWKHDMITIRAIDIADSVSVQILLKAKVIIELLMVPKTKCKNWLPIWNINGGLIRKV